MKTLTYILLLIVSLSMVTSCGTDTKHKNKGPEKLDNSSPTNTPKKSNPPSSPKVKLKVSDALAKENKAARGFQADLERFILAECASSEKLFLEELSASLFINYPQSYNKTKKEDGKSFCIHDIHNNSDAISRIFYTRTEGGHYSDEIALWSLNKKTNNLKQLVLFSEFRKEGFHQQINTSIASPFTFTVTQIDNPESKNPANTVKKYKLLDNGDIISL